MEGRLARPGVRQRLATSGYLTSRIRRNTLTCSRISRPRSRRSLRHLDDKISSPSGTWLIRSSSIWCFIGSHQALRRRTTHGTPASASCQRLAIILRSVRFPNRRLTGGCRRFSYVLCLRLRSSLSRYLFTDLLHRTIRCPAPLTKKIAGKPLRRLPLNPHSRLKREAR